MNEANSTLSDPTKRKIYDAGGTPNSFSPSYNNHHYGPHAFYTTNDPIFDQFIREMFSNMHAHPTRYPRPRPYHRTTVEPDTSIYFKPLHALPVLLLLVFLFSTTQSEPLSV